MARIENEHRCGWVALMGPPNAGKSTLLNALLGQKISIVTSKPQTTRSRVVGIMSEPGAQVIFMDTPGVNHSRQQQRGHLSKMMSQAAWQSMAAAHAIMLGSRAFTVGSGFRSLLDPDQIQCKPIRDGKKIKIGWLCSQQKPLSENAKQYAALLAQEINARENG